MRVAARWLPRLLPQLWIEDVLAVAKVMMEESEAEDEGQKERHFAELLYEASKNEYGDRKFSSMDFISRLSISY
jgi:hypothetical protein